MNEMEIILDLIPVLSLIGISSVYLYNYAFRRSSDNIYRFRTSGSLFLGMDTFATVALIIVYCYAALKINELIEIILVFLTKILSIETVIDNLVWGTFLPFIFASIIIYDFIIIQNIYYNVQNEFVIKGKINTKSYALKNNLISRIFNEVDKPGKGINIYVILRSIIIGTCIHLFLIESNYVGATIFVVVLTTLLMFNLSHMMSILTLKELPKYNVVLESSEYKNCYILAEKNGFITILWEEKETGKIIQNNISINRIFEIIPV